MQQSFVNDICLAAVRRDLMAPFASRRSVVLLATLIGLAGVIGPFGTFDAYPPALRCLYWLCIILATAAIGHATVAGLERLLARTKLPAALQLAMIAVVTAVPVCLVVALVSLVFGFNPFHGALPTLYLQCVAVMAGLVVVFHLAEQPRTHTPSPAGAAAPDLLKRLPPAKRGRLLHLRAQDHYVEVVTEKGEALIAMRLRDAVAETVPEAGVQCHRSHWVALQAIEGRSRQQGRAGLRLTNGSFVPVGRTYDPAVKDALVAPSPSGRCEDAFAAG